MPSDYPYDQFKSSEELQQILRERSDDFTHVTMLVANDLTLSDGGITDDDVILDCCSQIHLMDGTSILMNRVEFETCLNSGILQRMNIPIKLIPIEDR